MGFTGLARWVNSPTTGLDLVKQNIVRNHAGIDRGRWFLSVRAYRSVFATVRGLQVVSERSLCALTLGNHVFALLEDPAAPTRAEFLQALQPQPMSAPDAPMTMNQTPDMAHPQHGSHMQHPHGHPHMIHEPPHYRHTYLTLSPPGSLEQLLSQLRARWLSTRQPTSSSTTSARAQNQTSGQQLVIDGSIFSIGTDWIVRVGNVILAGGAVKGMLLEAEYLPIPAMHPETVDGTSELLSNLLTSILPNVPNARTVAVTISDAQWEEVLYHRREPGDTDLAERNGQAIEDDLFVYEDDKDANDNSRTGDWVGLERDRRSAFLIIGALKSEGIL